MIPSFALLFSWNKSAALPKQGSTDEQGGPTSRPSYDTRRRRPPKGKETSSFHNSPPRHGTTARELFNPRTRSTLARSRSLARQPPSMNDGSICDLTPSGWPAQNYLPTATSNFQLHARNTTQLPDKKR